MQDFRKLKVLEKAHDLTLAIYKQTASFPDSERYGMISQMRRSCASIPTNIAEGCGRGGKREFAQFLRTAIGSASELEYQILLAHDLKLIQSSAFAALERSVQEIRRMLASLLRTIQLRTED